MSRAHSLQPSTVVIEVHCLEPMPGRGAVDRQRWAWQRAPGATTVMSGMLGTEANKDTATSSTRGFEEPRSEDENSGRNSRRAQAAAARSRTPHKSKDDQQGRSERKKAEPPLRTQA
nr:unnamed protein product [Digitaria exilis]